MFQQYYISTFWWSFTWKDFFCQYLIDFSVNNFSIEFKLFDDAIAYRYSFLTSQTINIQKELSSWKLPANMTIYYQDHLDCYEGNYTMLSTSNIPNHKIFGLPITVVSQDEKLFMMITESNLVNYTDLAVMSTNDGSLTAFFHADPKGFLIFGPSSSPWRVILVTENLNSLVNSDTITSLADPPTENFEWVKPGRSTWHWLMTGAPKFKEQEQWIINTEKLGFEYYLIDEGWNKWKTEDKDCWSLLSQIVEFANRKKVKIFLWVNSREVNSQFLEKAQKTGVVGVKIDFFPPASYSTVNFYEHILSLTSKLHLMVNFHGAVKPTGRQRTWPHELSREAIRGHEWLSPQMSKSSYSPQHVTILPFTRYVQGPADFTPAVISFQAKNPFSIAHEIGSAIVFTSPFLCFADLPEIYLSSFAYRIIRSIPSTYDETIVLPQSKIGQCAIFARRKNNHWYLGGLNDNKKRNVTIDFSFLSDEDYVMLYVTDDNKERLERINSKTNKNFHLKQYGGIAAHIYPMTDIEL